MSRLIILQFLGEDEVKLELILRLRIRKAGELPREISGKNRRRPTASRVWSIG